MSGEKRWSAKQRGREWSGMPVVGQRREGRMSKVKSSWVDQKVRKALEEK
jgi:hypothetical protein